MKFSISSLVSALDPYQPSSFAVGFDMGMSSEYQSPYEKCRVIISYYRAIIDFICALYYPMQKRLGVMVFKTTFNNISVISWQSDL